MTFFGGPDPLKVVRNTETLDRERARRRAAWAAGRRAYFTGLALWMAFAIGLAVISCLHFPGVIRFAAAVVGTCGALAMAASGLIQARYLRSHPSDV